MYTKLKNLLGTVKKDGDVNAAILFGSAARKEDNSASDVDICLVLNKKESADNKYFSRKKLEYLSKFPFDIQIFQQLPVYIRIRILKDGKIIFCRNQDELYDIAFRTIDEFSGFKHFYREYLEEVADAG